MKFSEVSVGQKFVFGFDKSQRDGSYYFSYEKVGKNKVKCLSCPKTENCVGTIFPFVSKIADCHVVEEKKEEKGMGYKITSNEMNIGTAYSKETFSSLVRLVYLSCYKKEIGFDYKTLEVESGGLTTPFSFIEDTVYEIVEQYFD